MIDRSIFSEREKRTNKNDGDGTLLDNPEMKMQVTMLTSQVSIVPSGS